MAKKSSKSTRRARAKKQETVKKPTKAVETAVIVEGSDEPVMKVTKETPVKKKTITSKKKTDDVPEKPLQSAVEAKVERAEQEPVQEMLQPTRRRMLVSVFALGVIVVALAYGAMLVHQRNNATKNSQGEMVQSGQDSGKADQILQSGGNVCTNGSSQTDTSGSSSPTSVGMMLQSNPVSTIQTPETFSTGNDVNTLQGASCF